jgi:hypothetical protein
MNGAQLVVVVAGIDPELDPVMTAVLFTGL